MRTGATIALGASLAGFAALVDLSFLPIVDIESDGKLKDGGVDKTKQTALDQTTVLDQATIVPLCLAVLLSPVSSLVNSTKETATAVLCHCAHTTRHTL